MFGITVLVYYKGKYFKSFICYIVKGNYLILWDILYKFIIMSYVITITN